jgi:Zn-dependent protease with chaperone function
MFLFLPGLNAFTRSMEREADRFALEATVPHTVSPEGAISMFERLGSLSLTDPSPNPLVHLWLGSHPSIDSRIEAIRSYPE